MISKNKDIRKLLSSQTGASMVEFALILPMFLLLIFGTIEFSLLLYNKAMLTNAAREGARLGIVFKLPQKTPLNEVQAAVTNYCSDHMITFSSTNGLQTPLVKIIDAAGAERAYTPSFTSGEYIKVTANYNYTFLVLPNIFKLINATGIADLPTPWPLTAVSQMRAE